MTNQRLGFPLSVALFTVFLLPALARAEIPEFHVVIQDHRFHPADLVVPAGQKLKLTVENQDATPEEFESYDFNREKIVPGHGRIVVFIGPLKPGRYAYFGEFNPATARGWLIAQ